MDGSAGYYTATGDTTALQALIDRRLLPEDAPQAARIDRNVPVYDMARWRTR